MFNKYTRIIQVYAIKDGYFAKEEINMGISCHKTLLLFLLKNIHAFIGNLLFLYFKAFLSTLFDFLHLKTIESYIVIVDITCMK